MPENSQHQSCRKNTNPTADPQLLATT